MRRPPRLTSHPSRHIPAMLAVLLALAGCMGIAPQAEPTTVPAPTQADGAPEAPATPETSDSSNPTATGTPTATATPQVTHTPRDAPSADQPGWENGFWHDEPVDVTVADGLNESERQQVISRAMARVEEIRGLEFEQSVPVSVKTRDNFTGFGGETPDATRTFDNAKFEALFVVGEDEDSVSVQERSRSQTVRGFYSTTRDELVIVSESERPRLTSERTLAHELVHALQDQHFDLRASPARTRDAYNGRNGLIEGDAMTVQFEYLDRCGETWSCLDAGSGNGNGTASGGSNTSADEPPNFGTYFVSYFPYAEGPGLIAHLRQPDGEWDAVNAAYENMPTSTVPVFDPGQYPDFEPVAVSVGVVPSNGWEQVRPRGRLPYAVPGPSAIAAGFAATLYDDFNATGVIEPARFLNLDGETVNRTRPLTYDLPAVRGWRGGRLQVYERPGQAGGGPGATPDATRPKTAYVWRTKWASPTAAAEFAETYRQLISHWGGVRNAQGLWVIGEKSPYADAFAIAVDGSTVTVVNAPTVVDLSELNVTASEGPS